MLRIEAEGMTQVSVYNALGQCVLKVDTTDDQTSVDLQGVSSGLYLLRVKTEKGTDLRRITVER